MDRIVDRPGALDVHKASVTACVRVWEGRELTEHLAEFKTTVHGLLALRDWLEALGVQQLAMEATGVYWKPVWAVLEDRFELMLVNARAVKQVPGSRPPSIWRRGPAYAPARTSPPANAAPPRPAKDPNGCAPG